MRALPKNSVFVLVLSAISCAAETVVLRNFTLIDGTGKAAVPDAALVITDGKIQYAGPASGVKQPAGAVSTDLKGRYVMPGIINLHGHVGNVLGLVQDPKNYTRANAENNLKTYASYRRDHRRQHGHRCRRRVSDPVRAARAGGRHYTRIYTAGKGFTGKAGYPTSAPGMKGVPFEVENCD